MNDRTRRRLTRIADAIDEAVRGVERDGQLDAEDVQDIERAFRKVLNREVLARLERAVDTPEERERAKQLSAALRLIAILPV